MKDHRLAFVNTSRIIDVTHLFFRVFLAELIIVTATLVSATEAFSNETTARLGAGGITFTKSADIRLLEEILEISTKAVRAKFRFRNESLKDIKTTVAFPVAPRPWLPDADGSAFIMATFKVWVDGRSVAPGVVRKAVVVDHDVTAQLRKLGLFDKQIFGKADEADLTKDQENAVYNLIWAKGKQISDLEVAETAF